MQTLSQKIDVLIEEYSLLKHPFYQSWSAGTLTKDMLAGYSKEYYQLVKAVPVFSAMILANSPVALQKEVQGVYLEEKEHIGFWEKFARALDIDLETIQSYQGMEKTNVAVQKMTDACTDFASAATVMYAFEKEIPMISKTKLEGLDQFYGMTSKDATDYFVIHSEADVRHAALWREVLDGMPAEKHDALLAIAKLSLEGQNEVLDACWEGYCRMD
jgi:pyrroloquinoline-quinone synthase